MIKAVITPQVVLKKEKKKKNRSHRCSITIQGLKLEKAVCEALPIGVKIL